MQLSAEEVLDLRHETTPTRRLYGLEDPVTSNFGTRCLMARRLVESGVRFVQVMVPVKSGGMPWDHHENIKPGLEALVSASRRAHGGLDTRLETARAARFDDRPLDGRVRPFADLATRERPRPQPQCI